MSIERIREKLERINIQAKETADEIHERISEIGYKDYLDLELANNESERISDLKTLLFLAEENGDITEAEGDALLLEYE